MEGDVVEKIDLDAEGDDLAQVESGAEMFAAGAEVVEGEVAGTGEFYASREDAGVEVEDGAELDLDAELDGGGREGPAVDNPAAAVGEGVGEQGQEGGALGVAEALDVVRLHELITAGSLSFAAAWFC